MIVELLKKEDEKLWDEFVKQNDDATFFHQIGWKQLVENVYRYRPFYLMARDSGSGTISGILPLFLIDSFVGGRRLISLPFSVLGGLCCVTKVAERMLIEKAVELSRELNVRYLELRQTKRSEGPFQTSERYVNFVLRLDSDPDEYFKMLRPDIRRCLRRAKENDLEIRIDSGQIEDFYRIYSIGQRNFGTPVESFRWIEGLFDTFPENHLIATVSYRNRIILAKIIRKYRDEVSPLLSYGLKEFRNLYAEHLLLWHLIEQAYREGYRRFVFGRSIPSSGTFSFKIGWRAEPMQLYYQYYLHRARGVMDMSQEGRKRRMFARIWRKMPLTITNSVGPIIRRWYP